MEVQGSPQHFEVKPVPSLMAGTDVAALAAFQQKTSELMGQIKGAGQKITEAYTRLEYLKAALKETPKATAQAFCTMEPTTEPIKSITNAAQRGTPFVKDLMKPLHLP